MHNEQFNLSFSIPGEEQVKWRPGTDPNTPNNISRLDMKRLVENSTLDSYTKSELVKMVNMYPGDTMIHFYKNIRKHIANIQDKKS